jgi:hypothetical protein
VLSREFLIGLLLTVAGLALAWTVVAFTSPCVPQPHGCPDDIFLLPIFMLCASGIILMLPLDGKKMQCGKSSSPSVFSYYV